MNWASVWTDILLGLAIAGALAAWVPDSFWQQLFLVDHPLVAKIWGPLIGPAVAMASFTCSVGNVPLAAVLWNSGISFGGVVSFLFADLIIVPILLIYRKYYGRRMALRRLGLLYGAMVVTGLVVEAVFGLVGLVPETRNAQAIRPGISLDYTTVLNVVFLVLAAVLVIRFIRGGGWSMLSEMGGSPDDTETAETAS